MIFEGHKNIKERVNFINFERKLEVCILVNLVKIGLVHI